MYPSHAKRNSSVARLSRRRCGSWPTPLMAAWSSRLHAVIEEQGKWAKAGDLERFNDADLAFHKILYDAAGVPDLWALVRKRSGHIDRIRRLHLPIGGKATQIVRDHEAIVNAISKGEPDLAQSELRDHLSRSLAFSDELRVRFPGYFKE